MARAQRGSVLKLVLDVLAQTPGPLTSKQVLAACCERGPVSRASVLGAIARLLETGRIVGQGYRKLRHYSLPAQPPPSADPLVDERAASLVSEEVLRRLEEHLAPHAEPPAMRLPEGSYRPPAYLVQLLGNAAPERAQRDLVEVLAGRTLEQVARFHLEAAVDHLLAFAAIKRLDPHW